jgi:NTE family protein
MSYLPQNWGRLPFTVHFALLLIALGGSSCAHYYVNSPVQRLPPAEETYRFSNVQPKPNPLFVCLSFSGGGTRAAALAYGVMEELNATPVAGEQGVTLLDHVACISSVSGGSFPAAYYGLFGKRMFQDFRTRMLERNLETAIILRAITPVNTFRLLSPEFSRSDVAAETYDSDIFEHKTYGDLIAQKNRPYIVLNATDLATGSSFEFTQDQFNLIGSNLGDYPITRAVTASSAFPILLTPITLYNNPVPPGFEQPLELTNGVQSYYADPRRYHRDRTALDYLDLKSERPFIHLVDGGLADNIGLRPIENAYQESDGFIRPLINGRLIKQFVVIVVNARTVSKDTLSQSESPPGVLTVGLKTATTAMDNYSFETVQFARDLVNEEWKAKRTIEHCEQHIAHKCGSHASLPTLPDVKPYVIEVNFDAIKDKDRRKHFLTMPTNFALTKQQVQELIDVAKELLLSNPTFQCLENDLEHPDQASRDCALSPGGP